MSYIQPVKINELSLLVTQLVTHYTVSNVLIDTGSATTLLSAEVALVLGLDPELTDTIQTMRGIGGKEALIFSPLLRLLWI
jgi:hypothetical protein